MSDWREHLAGRRVVASVSGGKDSAAMCLWLQEQGVEHDRVFMDTGWENNLTYEYLRGPLTKALGPITEIRSEKYEGMADLCRSKGMFPSRVIRFCTQELKVRPMIAFLAGRMDAGEDVVNAVGIRAGESEARSKMGEWEWSKGFDCETWRPLITWSEQDVIDIHGRHGLAPNPLYLQGASRVGCWPCIFARKSELVFLADNDPARIETLRDLERDVQAAAAAARYAREGETFESKGYTGPTFFQASGRLRSEGRDGAMVPIDEVIRWARTARGGRQFELFAPEHEEGCVRWGLCDTGSADKEAA